MKKPAYFEHILKEPIEIPASNAEDTHIHALYVFPPTHAIAMSHRQIHRIVSNADKARQAYSAKLLSEDVMKNLEYLESLAGNDDTNIKEMIEQSLDKKRKEESKKGVSEKKEEETVIHSDDDILNGFFYGQIVPHITKEELNDLYSEFQTILKQAHSTKMICLDSLKEQPIASGVKTLLSIDDIDYLLAKYLYFFMAT